MRRKPGLALDRLRLFAAVAGGEAELGGEFAHLVVVVAAIERRPCGRLGVGLGRSIGIDSIVARVSLKSLRFAPAGQIAGGTPFPSVSSDRFAPF